MNTNSEVLGGVTTTSTSTSTITPGKVAKASRVKPAPKVKNGFRADGTRKRAYTPRNATYQARRVVLLDGVPAGKGRPQKEGRGKRMVVYVPVGMDYNLNLHGLGVKFNSQTHGALRRIAKDSVDYSFVEGIVKKVKATKSVAIRKAAKRTTVVVAKIDMNAVTPPRVKVDRAATAVIDV